MRAKFLLLPLADVHFFPSFRVLFSLSSSLKMIDFPWCSEKWSLYLKWREKLVVHATVNEQKEMLIPLRNKLKSWSEGRNKRLLLFLSSTYISWLLASFYQLHVLVTPLDTEDWQSLFLVFLIWTRYQCEQLNNFAIFHWDYEYLIMFSSINRDFLYPMIRLMLVWNHR